MHERPNNTVITFNPSKEQLDRERVEARIFPEDKSIIIESNRAAANLWIKQGSAKTYDFDGLAYVMKTEFDPNFPIDKENPVPMIKELYKKWDEKYAENA